MGCGASSANAQYAPDAAAAEEAVEATAIHQVQAGETAISPKGNEASKGSGATPEASKSASTSGAAAEQLPGAVGASEEVAKEEPGAWWSLHTDWIRHSAWEIVGAYNFFFEHIGIRKGWRTPPFKKEEVQAPFMASAEVVAVVRKRIDEQGGGMVLRQLEGSSHDFLWGWSPAKPPSQALEEFFRGLVFATLSDAKGLVEGLDSATVEYYVRSHPILEQSSAMASHAAAASAMAAPADAQATPPAASAAPVEAADAEKEEEKEAAASDGKAAEPEASKAEEATKAEEPGATAAAAPSAAEESGAKATSEAPMMLADAPGSAPMMLADATPGA